MDTLETALRQITAGLDLLDRLHYGYQAETIRSALAEVVDLASTKLALAAGLASPPTATPAGDDLDLP